jgi:hypothetical protein
MTGSAYLLPRYLLGMLALMLAANTVCAACPAGPDETGLAPASERTNTPALLLDAVKNQNKPLALIVVPERQEWLMALAAPVAAKFREYKRTPILLALPSENVARQTSLLKQLAPFVGSCTVLTADPDLPPCQMARLFATSVVPRFDDPTEIGLFLAKNCWQKAKVAIVVTAADPEALIVGSTLAAHLGVPLIPMTNRADSEAISGQLRLLNVESILLVASDTQREAESVNFSGLRTQTVDTADVQKRIIQTIGSSRIKNLILFRVPDELGDEAASSWLAPYLSLMRGAAVVPCHSANASEAEENARALIRAYSLKPRTVTILGHYDSIGTITTEQESESGNYETVAEPCSRPVEGQAPEMGVGRIPFRELGSASTLVARTIAREHILSQTKPKVMMIANPSPEYGSLPLCETMSQATAGEFKNLGIDTDEFYGVACHAPAVLSSARHSQLIIFEGHISDFTLFTGPSIAPDDKDMYDSEQQYLPDEDSIEVIELGCAQMDADFNRDWHQVNSRQANTGAQSVDQSEFTDYKMTETYTQIVSDSVAATAGMDPCELDGIPLIILQSCHSLDDSAASILVDGAVGLLGSVTNVHSASGSALIKAFCDGLLYRDSTVGEALRDARNYLLCVSALKSKRGHTQQAKVNRVAYSFHLWADPEANLFSALPGPPKLQPVSARFIAPDKIHITVPEKRLPTSRTEQYFLRMFPGSEIAGIVKRVKDSDTRRVTPIYFFRIAIRPGIEPERYTGLTEANGTVDRAVFLADSFKRFLYILYFPDNDKKGDEFTLQFVN